jgi:hypothetical protein
MLKKTCSVGSKLLGMMYTVMRLSTQGEKISKAKVLNPLGPLGILEQTARVARPTVYISKWWRPKKYTHKYRTKAYQIQYTYGTTTYKGLKIRIS